MNHGITLALAAFVMAACAEGVAAPATTSEAALSSHRADPSAGAVYTLTKQASGNGVAIFTRSPEGRLTYIGAGLPAGTVGLAAR